MLIKSKPYTPARRGKIFIARDKSIYNGPPKKQLTIGVKRSCGINTQGRKTVKGRGGAKHRRVLRIVNIHRRCKIKLNGIIERIEHDPNRSAYIALIKYEDETYNYIIATKNMKKGDFITTSLDKIAIQEGNRMPLKHIPQDIELNSLELYPKKRSYIATAAGTFVKIVGFNNGKATIKLPSGEHKELSEDCLATIGIVSKSEHKNIKYGGAGDMRRIGRTPKVRGMAKNSNDHPHGGGGGKGLGRHQCNPKGVRKGTKTRSKKKDKLNKKIK